MPKISIAVRGYQGPELKFEKRWEIPFDKLHTIVPKLASEHADAMVKQELTMVELEFLDDPTDPNRFFRIGTDPSGMVMPLAIDLHGAS